MRVINYLILCFIFIFLINGVSAQNLTCQYKEIKETNELVRVLYDQQGNRYTNILEIKNIAGGEGRISFDLVNKILLPVSIKVNFDVSNSGGGFWPNQEDFRELEPLETFTILNSVSSGSLGTSSVSNIRITYLSNDELEVKIEDEKRKEEICRLCDGKICLNDGVSCNEDSECGSRICNIAGYCGIQKIVDCPNGLQNCNNQSCLEPKIKKKGNLTLVNLSVRADMVKTEFVQHRLKKKF